MSTRTLFAFAIFALGCSGAANSASESGYVDDASSTGGDSSVSVSGLPCDVANVLATRCLSCHASPPIGGAPYAIASYEDLTKTAPGYSVTVAERSLARMQDTKSPMPPGGGATADEIAKLKAWIDGGMTKGDCSSVADAGPSEWSAPTGCVSGSTWTRGDRGSSSMHPGGTCISCHKKEGVDPLEAPTFLGGTVYSSAHETDDCNAVAASVAGAKVVVTGADGVVTTMNVNSVGNFYTLKTIKTPYKAKVVNAAGKERAMGTEQTNGDCNSCHTVDGVKPAPGRILLPAP